MCLVTLRLSQDRFALVPGFRFPFALCLNSRTRLIALTYGAGGVNEQNDVCGVNDAHCEGKLRGESPSARLKRRESDEKSRTGYS